MSEAGDPAGERSAAADGRRAPGPAADVLAGVTAGILAVPQGIAFALIAHVPPEHGLYAMIVPTIVAALVRSSPYLVTGATNTSALVIGAMVATFAASPAEAVPLMLLIVLLMGALQVAAGALRLGVFGRYVSQAVLVGFTLGAATLIFTDQIRNVLGVELVTAPRLVSEIEGLARHLGETDARALGVAAATWAILWACGRLSPAIPGAMIAIAATGFAAWALGWEGGDRPIRVVGELPAALPRPTMPSTSLEQAGQVFGASLAIAILGMVEAISIGKAVSARARIPFHANRELFAMGLGNLAGAFTGCMPTSASWTRSAVHLQMGARSRLAGVFGGLSVLAIVLAAAPFAAYVPRATLGAIIMWIAVFMVDLRSARYVWRWSRADAAVLVITYASTVFFPIQYAIYLGVFSSLVMLVRRAGRLHVVELVEVGPRTYREIELDEQTGASPLVLLQLEGDLFFGVAEELEDELEKIAARGARVVVIRLKRALAIDATAAEALATFATHFRERGGRLVLCGLKPDLLEQIAPSYLGEVLGPGNLLPTDRRHFGSLRTAVDSARRELAGRLPPGTPLTRRSPVSADALTYSI